MQRFAKLQILMVSIAVILLSLLYFFYPAGSGSFHPDCLFHQFTGLYCPGCGSQRAASALLHGQFLKAADLNVLFVASIPFIGWSGFVFTWNSFGDRKMSQKIFYSPVFVKGCLIIVVLFAILRNLPVTPFNRLAP
jgi:hypothetical protein